MGIFLICVHDFVPPFYRGFQCDDESIRYPYKDSTVSSEVCYIFGSGINIVLILSLEYLNLLAANKKNEPAAGPNNAAGTFQYKIYLRNAYCRLVVWLFGSITTELLTDITKVTAGRLRPHFLAVCQPMILNGPVSTPLEIYCNETKTPYEYITNYYCRNAKRDTRLSFLSGHSSYSAYSATFAVLYMQSALDITKLGLIKPALQVLMVSLAVYTGLSRVSDYKHHWQDVLAGLLLGTAVAAILNAFLWPPLQKAYERLTKSLQHQTISTQSGEELNRFSY